MIKSDREIDSARKAARIADAGQRVASEIVRAGIQEYEIAAEVEHIMRTLGSEDEGHRTIVSSGPRSVMGVFSGYSTDRVINDGDLVIVDTGATFDGYRSDLGRPYVAGKPSEKQRKIHDILIKAWDAAFAAVKPGVEGGDVDSAARKVLGKYQKYFDHEIGHGLGLSFEPPALTRGSKDLIQEKMIVTVEPGLYIDGVGGMIIEDPNIVLKDHAERLTSSPHEWS